mmetsp:Transcript_21552/g.83839  ORF Transcript_21552/g.83839 Transcript_21552/m.83839 type:complete len:271 (+) Transcript_21552:963-1775(+)
MQVGNQRLARRTALGDHLADLVDDRVVHLAVQQHAAGLGNQALGPDRHQHRTHQAHHRVQPGPAQPPAAGQRRDGGHRRGRIGHDMQIGRLEIQVVVVVMVVVPVRMARVVAVVMRLAEDEGTDEVHHQPQHRHGHRLGVVDGLGPEQALDRAINHQRHHAEQEDGTRKAAQHLDLPGAEGEARVARMPARRAVGPGAQADGHGVAAHVEAIGQQRHRVGEPAHHDLDRHHHQRDPHHPARAALGSGVAGVEDMVVAPFGEVVGVHGGRR